jgi:histone-lysine N-methyltransferase SETD2
MCTGALGGLARDTDNAAVREEVSSEVTEGVTNTREKVDASAGTTPRVSWVLCDNCGKWRCIPVDLADEIDATNRYWYA